MNYGEEFKNLITPLPKEFVEAGLDLEKISKGYNGGSYFTYFYFINRISQFQIEVHIGDNSGSVTIFFNKINENYFFNIDEYFDYIHRPNGYNELFFKKDLKTILKNICGLVSNELNDIITGKKWERVPRNRDFYR